MTTQDEAQLDQPDELEGVPAEFHSVVQEHGRGKWALAMNAGLAGEAAGRLALFVEKHQSGHNLHHLRMLVKAFNEVATEVARLNGWTKEELASCNADCLQAVAKGAPRIVLPTQH